MRRRRTAARGSAMRSRRAAAFAHPAASRAAPPRFRAAHRSGDEAAGLDVDHDGQEAAEPLRDARFDQFVRLEVCGHAGSTGATRRFRRRGRERVRHRRSGTRPARCQASLRTSVIVPVLRAGRRSRPRAATRKPRGGRGGQRFRRLRHTTRWPRVPRKRRRSHRRFPWRVARMRCAVGAEEELRIAGNGRFDQRMPMRFALQHRQAVQVRADATGEDRVAIQQQVLRRERGGDARARALHELDARPRRDVLEHHLEAREALDDRLSTRSMNTGSRSKTSTSPASVTSPCTCSTRSSASIASSAGQIRSIAVTPESEFVVAPAG